MKSRCGCVLTEDHVTQRGFQCFPSSPQAVTYRAELRGTREASVEDLLQDMQQWIQDASFPVQFHILTVDSSCDVSISSFSDPECTTGGNEEFGAAGNEQSTKIDSIIGALAFVGVVVLLVLIIIVILVIAMRRNQQASLKLQ